MAHRIRCFKPDGSHTDVDIDGPCKLGRAGGNTLVVDDEKASSKHAVIEITRSGKVQLRDLGSTNGTRVNGFPTEATVIVPGDCIEIGAHKLVLWDGGQPPSRPAKLDPRHAWRLVPKHGGAPWVVPPRATVGRSPDRDLTIDHETASSQHAILTCTADGLAVEDSGSSNGTWVDGTKVRRSVLKHGQVLAIGEVAFVVQHGGREVTGLTAARRKLIAQVALVVILVVGGGLVWLKYQGQARLPAPRPAPMPAPSPAPTVEQLPTGIAVGDIRVELGPQGSAGCQRGDRPVITDARLVVLTETGTVRGRQGDRQNVPENAVVVELSGRSASGYVWTGPDEGYPFTYSIGVTPRSAVAVGATLGTAQAPVIGGMRIDCAPGVNVAWVRRPDGTQHTPSDTFSEPEANEVALGPADHPLSLRFAKSWSVRGRRGPNGWELLVWRRSKAVLEMEWALGGRTRAQEAALVAVRAAAERAFDAKDFATAVTKYRELLARLSASDPDLPVLRERLSEAEQRAAEAAK